MRMRNLLGLPFVMVGLAGAAMMVPACGNDPGSEFDDAGTNTDGSSGSSGSSGNSSSGCFGCSPDGGSVQVNCVGLECYQDEKKGRTCADPGQTKTTLTGKVYDPAGRVPLYNVIVYVPNGDVAPITPGLGAECDRCSSTVSGSPIATAHTDASGSFTLENVPADIDFPVIMQIGKWRRKVTIPKVQPCQTTSVDTQDPNTRIMRLPRNRTEGDIPRIALATGGADPLECLFRKIGLDDSEFGTGTSDARVHLYVGGGVTSGSTPQLPTSSFAAGGAFDPAAGLWSDVNKLKAYDVVVLSCEGDENPSTKPVEARQALYDYAKVGGRVFTSHYHHYWFSNSPVTDVKNLATWVNDNTCQGTCTFVAEPPPTTIVNAVVDTTFDKGKAMKEWLRNTSSLCPSGAGCTPSSPADTLPIQEMRHNVDGPPAAISPNLLSWMTVQNPAATNPSNRPAHEYVSFNTPVGADENTVCGRVVYSDLHVGAGDATNKPFPGGCTTVELTPQQKALEFMLFDLSSCIQKDKEPPITK